MSAQNRKRLLMVMVVLWAGVIFFLSSQNAGGSDSLSSGFTRQMLSLFSPFQRLAQYEQAVIIENLQFIVRKTAHALLYFVLGILTSSLSFCYRGRVRFKLSVAAAGCLFYAVTDELHQWFVPGRSCEWRDVLIDFGGALAGICFLYLIRLLCLKVRENRQPPDMFSEH